MNDTQAKETWAQFEARNADCRNHWLNPGEHRYSRGRNRCRKCGRHPLRPNMNEMDALVWWTFRPAIRKQFETVSLLHQFMSNPGTLRIHGRM